MPRAGTDTLVSIWLRKGIGGRQALVNAVMNRRVPQNVWDFMTIRGPASFSRRKKNSAVCS